MLLYTLMTYDILALLLIYILFLGGHLRYNWRVTSANICEEHLTLNSRWCQLAESSYSRPSRRKMTIYVFIVGHSYPLNIATALATRHSSRDDDNSMKNRRLPSVTRCGRLKDLLYLDFIRLSWCFSNTQKTVKRNSCYIFGIFSVEFFRCFGLLLFFGDLVI